MSGLRAALAGTHEYRNWIFTPAEQLSLDSRHLAPLLSTSLSVLFAVWVPFRIWHLRGATLKVLPSLRGLVKAVIALLVLALQLVKLVVQLSSSPPPPSVANIEVLSAIATLVACLGLCPLLLLEHARSVRASDLAVVWLLGSLLCDAAELATTVHDRNPSFLLPTTAQICVTLLLLVVECQGKKSILRVPYQHLPPEQMASILNRTFFCWINAILVQGNKKILVADDLPSIDQKLSSKTLRQKALQAWDQRATPEDNSTLPRVLLRTLVTPFLLPIVPRLCSIAFKYAQPLLINRAIRYVNDADLKSEPLENGYLLVLVALLIYVGLAISSAVYQHRLNRLKIMIRGALIGLLHENSLHMQVGVYDDGRAVTLISTDADNVGKTAEFFHETWARIVEVILGILMLAKEVGWIWPVPLVIIFFCSRMSHYVAKNLKTKQRNWNIATQKRIAMTSSMLSSVKSLKMLGMIAYIETFIQNLRLQELEMSKKVRWMMVAYNASANALGIFSPAITLVLFAILANLNGQTLDTETAFTTVAILSMVTHPANMIMTIIPQVIASVADFERIQQYLLEPVRRDKRILLQETPKIDDTAAPTVAMCIEKVAVQNPSSSQLILRDVDFIVNKGSTVICSGPVGSGKTALAKAIIGELPTSSGTISVSTRGIGFCAQSAWLPSATIREAVCGFSKEAEISSSWYEEVIGACCLTEDLRVLPSGDETLIGSRGMNLSGGQRQRVALARVIYARCEIAVLDDSFSALDGKTEQRVVENLFGPAGLFKKMGTTVFFVTNVAQNFPLADWILVLGDSGVKDQGTWKNLKVKAQQLSKTTFADAMDHGEIESFKMNNNFQNQQQRVEDAVVDLSRRTGDVALYGYYIRSFGYNTFILLSALSATYSFFITFPQFWLKWWTEAKPSETWFYVGGYLLLSFLSWFTTSASVGTTHILVAPLSGAELHSRLLATIIGAPLSYFSDTTTGTILNRFSQDIYFVDRQLPTAFSGIGIQVFKLLVQVALLFSVQHLLALTLPFCMSIVYAVQKIYLRTSRQLRLLEIESRSAIYSSFLETIEGIITIRAFGWEKDIENENIAYLDSSQQPFYLLLCLQRWLNIVLDLLVAAIATGLIILAVLLKGTTSGGQIGVALNIVLVTNTTLLRVVEFWTDTEISLGAIARIKSLENDTPKEAKPWETDEPGEFWPSSGAVEIENVTVAYNSEAVALRDINLRIMPGQMCVICGRTGSGKSTLFLSLLCLLDAESGVIKIDGVDISRIPRSLVRQRCFITVPQDPLLLGEVSLRFNLDPSETVSESAIVAVLQETRLWALFNSTVPTQATATDAAVATQNILDLPLASLPHMSTGQAQLFSIARAIIQAQAVAAKNSSLSLSGTPHTKPILLLDEATSSLDAETETTIRDIIDAEFTRKGHTVIAITHRLNGVARGMRAGQDMAVRLAKGRVERIGSVEEIMGAESAS